MKMSEGTLEETPTWAVAVVCFVLVGISILIEHGIHLLGQCLKRKHKIALYESFEKFKAELMLLGFLSLLLTVLQAPISNICVSKSIGATWHPCNKKSESDSSQKLFDKCKESAKYPDNCAVKGKVPFVSSYGIHQLHIFIFMLAVSHVLYSIVTLAFGRIKMRKWKLWEDETKTIEYQVTNDPQRFRFTRETSFGRRHLSFWSKSTITIWIVCFFRQFFGSVTKVDYLALRHGFIIAHLAPGSETRFDFQKYISRSLDEDFKVVVGISPLIWLFAILFLLTNTHGWISFLWLPFFPLIIVLVVGAKLQVIITKMGLRIQERGNVVKGAPLVQPSDELFWFKKPHFILFLLHFVLFQNAFQLAFFAWSSYEFSIHSCFHKKIEEIIIRISMGVIIQVLCSYVTLPLYALVTQMGSTMRSTVFNDRVVTALRNWHNTAKKRIKQTKHSESTTTFSSRTTPIRGMSPVHLLPYFHNADSINMSVRESNAEFECRDVQGTSNPGDEGCSDIQLHAHSQNRETEEEIQDENSIQNFQSEINMNLPEFSFGEGRS